MKIKLDPLDVLFSRFIRLRADNHCEFCGKYVEFPRLQCSHFIGRRNRHVRYDQDNCIGVCFSCHNYLGEHPYEHTEFFKKHLGTEKLEQLIIKSNIIGKIDKEVIKASLKERIALLEGE